MMLLGCFPCAASFILWFIYSSQYRRNPYVSNGADYLRNSCLLCGAVMPFRGPANLWGAPVLHSDAWGVHALRVQLALMYCFAGLYKISAAEPNAWLSGEAVRQVFLCCDFLTHWSEPLLQFPQLCQLLTWFTLVIELLAPLILLLSTGVFVEVLVFLLLNLHIAMALTMGLADFSVVCIAALACAVPNAFWARQKPPRFGSWKPPIVLTHSSNARESFNCAGSVLLILLMAHSSITTWGPSGNFLDGDIYKFGHEPSCQRATATQPYLQVFCYNWVLPFTHKLGIVGKWNMFVEPPTMCGWYVLPAKLWNGTVLDALKLQHHHMIGSDGASLRFDRPGRYPALHYKSMLWHAWYHVLHNAEPAMKVQMEYQLESLTRFYCRRFPEILAIHVAFATERNGSQQNTALWRKLCSEYDGIGSAPIVSIGMEGSGEEEQEQSVPLANPATCVGPE
jgi:hypothetical protein